MDAWNFHHIFEFWDHRSNVLDGSAVRLSNSVEPVRAAVCANIRWSVERHAQALSDEDLLKMAVSLADDLYKFVNDEIYACPALYDYLDAVGKTFCNVLHARGYVIHYVVENQFSGVEFLLRGPFDLFKKVFNAAGFVYICPQQVGLEFMQMDGIDTSEYAQAIPRYSMEARTIADRLVNECRTKGLHYVFLDTDYEDGSLDVAREGDEDTGVIRVFRNDAPVEGSSVSVSFPSKKRMA